MWNIYCRKINADNTVTTVTTELIYSHTIWNTIVLHVCRPTLQHVTLYSLDTSIHFLCNILQSNADLSKSYPIFQAIQGKAGLTPLEKLSLITRFMEPTWGPSGAERTQTGPMLATGTLLSGMYQKKYIIRHAEDIRSVVTSSRCGDEVLLAKLTVPNTHLPISGDGSEKFNENMKVRIFKSN